VSFGKTMCVVMAKVSEAFLLFMHQS
jgi:hypothetical protein